MVFGLADELFLGVDVGTKAVKASILSLEKGLIESSKAPIYDLVERPRPTWAQRNPDLLLERIRKALNRLKYLSRVSGVCVDATSGSIVPVDKGFNPLYDILLYSDFRAVKEAEELSKCLAVKSFASFLPMAPYLVLPKIIWLKRNLPCFNKVHMILHESDFIVARLAGVAVTSPNVAGKAHALLEGSGYHEDVYREAGVSLSIMPPIRPIGEIVGYITREASRKFGLPEGIPVVNGVTDASACDIAAGVVEPGQANITMGTTITLHGAVDKPMPDAEGRFYYKAYVNRLFLAGGAMNAGTLPLDAVARAFSMSLEKATKLAEQAPPGCDGLIAQPEWTGTRVPKSRPWIKGFLAGITEDNFTAGHIFRALLEGNAIVVTVFLRIVEKVTGMSFAELRATGGGSRNDLQLQILADVSDKPVLAIGEIDGAVGSAMLAAYGVTGVRLSELAIRFIKVRKFIMPDTSRRSLYDELTRKFLGLVDAIADIKP